MKHRHLTHSEFSLAAIDDLIARGRRGDWEELRSALLEDPGLIDKVRQVCLPRISDPYAQRYHFWMRYVGQKLT